jgi:hypothetical protein
MKSLFANVYALCRVPYFPLLDSWRVYKQHGFGKAAKWFLVRLLVPFGFSQKRKAPRLGLVDDLCKTGYAELPMRTTTEVCELIDYFLQDRSAADSSPYRNLTQYFDHWRSRSILRPAGLKAMGRGNCPLTRLSRDPALTNLVCEYLGLPIERIRAHATIDALIRLESKALLIDGYDGAVEFHRDIDSWKWVKVFVYLTDTADGDGHHEVFSRSHLKTPLSLVPIRRYEQSEVTAALPEARLIKIFGAAGYTFIENTFAFHRGTEPSRNDRLILIVTYYDDSVASWMYPEESYPLG